MFVPGNAQGRQSPARAGWFRRTTLFVPLLFALSLFFSQVGTATAATQVHRGQKSVAKRCARRPPGASRQSRRARRLCLKKAHHPAPALGAAKPSALSPEPQTAAAAGGP